MTQKKRDKQPISLIVARNDAGYIGKNNQLLWRMPSDLRRFRELTTGGVVIMGRKTYESIGRPLPKRVNIVVSSQTDLKIEGCIVVHSIFSAMRRGRASGLPIYIIGGGHLYHSMSPFADRVYVTVVHDGGFIGDVKFPELVAEEWEINQVETKRTSTEDQFPSSFYELHRIKKAGA